MEIILIKLLQFMLAISLLVLLHEGGHFFFSKLFGVRVEKFYLFFDPQNVQPRKLRRLRKKTHDGGVRIKKFFHIATSGRIRLLYRNK